MGWINSITNLLFDDALAQAKAKLANAEIVNDQLRSDLAIARNRVALEESIRESVVRENKQIKTRNEQLIAENMDLTKRYVVPDVVRLAKPWFHDLFASPHGCRTVSGRIISEPQAQHRKSTDCKLSYLECEAYCLMGMDFAKLEARVLAATSRPPRFYAVSYDQKGKEPKESRWTYVYDRDKTGGYHVARFDSKEVADQYVLFRNSME